MTLLEGRLGRWLFDNGGSVVWVAEALYDSDVMVTKAMDDSVESVYKTLQPVSSDLWSHCAKLYAKQ